MNNINHPLHYNSHPSGIECIEVARHMSFNLGNVLKYIWRHGKKRSETNPDQLSNAIEDLEKAAWYIQNEIELLKEERDKLKSWAEDILILTISISTTLPKT